MADERRRYVRVRPAADYDLSVHLLQGGIAEVLQVVDLGTGGFGLYLEGALSKCKIGDTLRLKLVLPTQTSFEADAVVKHLTRAKAVCGVELVDLSEPQAAEMRRTVSELLARGNAV